jgi:hypothetical protein
MWNIVILVAALAVLSLGGKLLMPLIARIFAGAIGKEALSRQPDHIHLTPAPPEAWKNEEAANAITKPLLGLGFKDAGTYRIQELPGVIVRLHAKPDESFYSAVYEHPRAGVWFDLVARYQDGTSYTATTAMPTGLKPRPGDVMMNLRGTSPQAIYARARNERRRGALKPATLEGAVADFESAYAESMAWRKSQGPSTKEVVSTAKRKVA